MSRSQKLPRLAEPRLLESLLPHPPAAEVPTLSEPKYRALRDDIARRGLLVPLEITARGMVLDGRARLRAARELGHETVTVVVISPEDELEHILRAALLRRHLDGSQRAALALKLLPFEQLRAAVQERQRETCAPEPRWQPCPHGREPPGKAAHASLSQRSPAPAPAPPRT